MRGENSPSTSNVYSYYEEVVLSDVIGDLAKAKGISRNAASQLVHNAGYEIYACIDGTFRPKVDTIYTDPEKLPKTYGSTKSAASERHRHHRSGHRRDQGSARRHR